MVYIPINYKVVSSSNYSTMIKHSVNNHNDDYNETSFDELINSNFDNDSYLDHY